VIFLWPSGSFASQSDNYILEISNLSSGGYPEESVNFYFTEVVIGQEIGGEVEDLNYILSAGYIYLGQTSPVVNPAPTLDAIGDKTISEGQALSFTVTAADPDNNTLIYTASGLPAGANFNSATATFSWTPTYTQSGAYSNVHFEVSDGGLTDSEDITITVTNVNRTPILNPISDKVVNEGTLLQFTVTASDPDNDPIAYSASSLPAGASFNPDTKTFSWTPDYTQSGIYPGIHFQVTDNDLSSFKDVTIIVMNVNRQPLLGSIGNKSISENQLLQFKIEASDPDGDTLTYSASNLPSGAEFNIVTQIFSWIPISGQAGVYADVHFTVSDGPSNASEDIAITVSDATPPDRPTIDPVTSPTTTAAQTITGTKSPDAVRVIVGSVQATIDPVSYPTPATWSCTATLQEGDNDFTVVSEDDLGNQSLAALATITLDTLPPDFTITFPPDGSYIDRHGNVH